MNQILTYNDLPDEDRARIAKAIIPLILDQSDGRFISSDQIEEALRSTGHFDIAWTRYQMLLSESGLGKRLELRGGLQEQSPTFREPSEEDALIEEHAQHIARVYPPLSERYAEMMIRNVLNQYGQNAIDTEGFNRAVEESLSESRHRHRRKIVGVTILLVLVMGFIVGFLARALQ